jgi:hypothetical protein
MRRHQQTSNGGQSEKEGFVDIFGVEDALSLISNPECDLRFRV